MDLLAVHLLQSLSCTGMSLICDICEALGLLGLPVISNSNGFDFAETSESVANVIFFEGIGEVLDEKSTAVRGHGVSEG